MVAIVETATSFCPDVAAPPAIKFARRSLHQEALADPDHRLHRQVCSRFVCPSYETVCKQRLAVINEAAYRFRNSLPADVRATNVRNASFEGVKMALPENVDERPLAPVIELDAFRQRRRKTAVPLVGAVQAA